MLYTFSGSHNLIHFNKHADTRIVLSVCHVGTNTKPKWIYVNLTEQLPVYETRQETKTDCRGLQQRTALEQYRGNLAQTMHLISVSIIKSLQKHLLTKGMLWRIVSLGKKIQNILTCWTFHQGVVGVSDTELLFSITSHYDADFPFLTYIIRPENCPS